MREKQDTFEFPDGFDLDAFVLSWAKTTCYPILHVEITDSQLQITTTVVATHNIPFFIFPIKVEFPNQERFVRTWMDSETPWSIHVDGTTGYRMAVVAHEGMMRVNYDETNWIEIIKYFKKLRTKDKGALVSDAYYFFKQNELPLKYVFLMLKQFRNERSPVGWRFVEHVIVDLSRRFRFSPVQERFNSFMRNLTDKFYDAMRVHKSALAVQLACMAGHVTCLEQSRDKTIKFLTIEQEIRFRDTVLCAGMRFMDDDFYDYLMGKPNHTTKNSKVILMAMSCMEKQHKINKFIRSIMKRGILDLTPAYKLKLMVNAFMSSESGGSSFWEFFHVRHQIIYDTFDRKQFHRIAYMLSR